MRDFPLCPSCSKPVWEDQPEYCGWHQWCAEQASSASSAMQQLMAQQFNQPYTDEQLAAYLNASYQNLLSQPWGFWSWRTWYGNGTNGL